MHKGPAHQQTGAHASDVFKRIFDLPDEAATQAFGQRLAHALPPTPTGLRIHLSGNLGAGKTTLVRETLRALGYAGRVRSPTYTLVESYTLPVASHPPAHAATQTAAPLPTPILRQVYHFDLYRLGSPAEWQDAGFRDYLGSDALCFIEWPEQADALLGIPDLHFTLAWSSSASAAAGRQLIAQAFTERGKRCLAAC